MTPSDSLFKEFSQFEDDSVMLAFRGQVSSDLLGSLLNIAENKLTEIGYKTSKRKKAFNVLVECVQNMYNHAKASGKPNASRGDGSGVLIMIATNDSISIATGNNIGKEQAEVLKLRLEHLNELEEDNLREEYKKQLVEGKFSERGGAGLGFIDIARKSGHQLEYRFLPLDDERIFFTLNVKVS